MNAASFSYYMILAIFPLGLIVNGFLSFLHLELREVMEVLDGVFPSYLIKTLQNYVFARSVNNPLVNAVCIYLILMAISAAIRLYSQVNVELTGQEKRSGLLNLGASVMISLAFLLVLFLSCVLLLAGKWVLTLFSIEHFSTIWTTMRFSVMFFLFFFLLWGVYALSNIRGQLEKTFIGAAFASLVLVIVGVIFSQMMAMSMNYQLVYGSLASIIILMLWFYLFGNILFIGNILNEVLQQRRMETRREKLAMGKDEKKK